MCRNLAECLGSVFFIAFLFSFLKALYSDIIYILSILQRSLVTLSSLCDASDAVLALPHGERPLAASLCFCVTVLVWLYDG